MNLLVKVGWLEKFGLKSNFTTKKMKKIIVSIYSEKAESQVKQYLDSEKIQYSSIDFDENLFIDEEDFDFDLEDLKETLFIEADFFEDVRKEIEIPIKWK